MSDAKTRQRWEARRKMIADDFFAGDEANAETVLDCLPYSNIPDWGDVALLMQSMDAAGLLATPTHDAAVAARALREWIADWPTTPGDGTFLNTAVALARDLIDAAKAHGWEPEP